MRKIIQLSLLLLIGLSLASFSYTKKDNFGGNPVEFLQFRMHYGYIDAGFANLTTSEAVMNGKNCYRIVGKGWTAGVTNAVFTVNDTYETYIDKATNRPIRFIRRTNEGGHTKNTFIDFRPTGLTVNDLKHKVVKNYNTNGDIQDVISAVYKLRSYPNTNMIKGKYVDLNMFMHDELLSFRLMILGRETIDSDFGPISCIKLKPYARSGKAFKANEGINVWVSDDANMVPIRVKADLMIGSLIADLNNYKNLKVHLKTQP